MSVPTGHGQPSGSPWEPPPEARWVPGPPARRGHKVLWIVLGVCFVLFVLPLMVVVLLIVRVEQKEHQPPQSLYDDATAVATALTALPDADRVGGAAGSPTNKPGYELTDPVPVRVTSKSVAVGDPAVAPPTVVPLGSGNSATVTGTLGGFCIRVSHPGAQSMFYDSTWKAVQYGRGRSGACS